jgi:L-rhamnose-H+ transport protein
MNANPFLGVFFHWLGGLASASFYIPYRGVKKWSWETYWLVGGFFSWIIAPMLLAWLLVPDLWTVIGSAPMKSLVLAYVFGVMWGLGGLTFGLTMRYLGIALGMAIALGYCAAVGTLVPPIYNGEFGKLLHETSGQWVLLGVAVCLAGIAVSGMAGMSKERELTEEQKKATIQEFNFIKGILVATFSGVMSAAFAIGLDLGKPIGELAKASLEQHGATDLWQNLPVLIIVLWGGFTTNFIWCVLLNIKNKSGGEYFAPVRTVVDEAKGAPAVQTESVPLVSNYVFSAIAGTTWYLQFFFYSMGQTRMGKYEFSSWTLHMASIIIFSTLWGIALREWKGTSRRTHMLIAIGLAVLIGSTIIVGYGNFLKTGVASH